MHATKQLVIFILSVKPVDEGLYLEQSFDEREVRDSECLVYKALKTSLTEGWFSALCARQDYLLYVTPSLSPSPRGRDWRQKPPCGPAGPVASLRNIPVHENCPNGVRALENRPPVHKSGPYGARETSRLQDCDKTPIFIPLNRNFVVSHIADNA